MNSSEDSLVSSSSASFADAVVSLSNEQQIYNRICEMIVPNCASPERFSRHIRESIRLNEEEAFVERLATFTSLNWSVKSWRISPPRCASYGWRVVDKDMMQCCTCQKFLSVQLPPVWNHTHDEAVNRLEKSLKDSHDTCCPWSFYPSPENFLSNKLLKSDMAILEFGDRLAALNDVGTLLPRISTDIPETLKMSEADILNLSDLVGIHDQLRYEALAIALTGWRVAKDGITSKRICCNYCLRKIELSLYSASELPPEDGSHCRDGNESIKTTSSDEIADGDASAKPDECRSPRPKKSRKWELRPFHPLDEHQKWCPWVAGDGENPVSHPGWKRLLNMLRLRLECPKAAVDDEAMATLRGRILAVKKIVREWTAAPNQDDQR